MCKNKTKKLSTLENKCYFVHRVCFLNGNIVSTNNDAVFSEISTNLKLWHQIKTIESDFQKCK